MPTKQQQDFVKLYYPFAVKAAAGSKIHPDTIITAAALESGFGKSALTSKYNNFFGRKPEASYKGKVIKLKTREVLNGKDVYILAPFKWYESPADAFKDYVKLLSTAKRYAAVLTKTDPKEQFREIQKAGYATDPKYSDTLASLLDNIKPFFQVTTSIGILLITAGVIYLMIK